MPLLYLAPSMGTKKKDSVSVGGDKLNARRLWDGLNPEHVAEYTDPLDVGTYSPDEDKGHIDPDVPDSVFEASLGPVKRAFLTAYAMTLNREAAAEAAGITPQATYTRKWMDNPVFTRELERARDMAGEVLVAAAFRRAVTGTVRFTGWYQGTPGGIVREYSDILLIFLIKGALPERYGDRVQLRTQLQGLDLGKLPDPLIRRIAAGEPLLAVLAGVADQIPELMRRLPVPETPKTPENGGSD